MPKAGNVSLELLGTASDFEKIVISAINEAFANAIKASVDSIKKNLETLVYDGINDCPELTELRGGTLRGEMGLTSSEAREASENISRAVSQSILVEQKKTSAKKGVGGLNIYVQPSSFGNVLGIENASITYYSKKNKTPVVLDWLSWLLKEGDRIIVSSFDFDLEAGRGRTGLGKMKKGGSWRVSPQYAGTEDDNFITRALGSRALQGSMASIIEKAIKKNWK